MIEWILAQPRRFDGTSCVFSTPAGVLRRDRRPARPACRVVDHRAPAHVPRLLQRDARHQARAAPRRAAARPGRDAAVDAFAPTTPSARRCSPGSTAAWDDLLFTEFHDILDRHLDPVGVGQSVRAMQGRARIAGEEVLSRPRGAGPTARCRRVDDHQIVVAQHRPRAACTGFVEAEPYLDFDDWGDALARATRTARPSRSRRSSPTRTQLIPRVLVPRPMLAPPARRQVLVRDDPAPADGRARSDLAASATRSRTAASPSRCAAAARPGSALDGIDLLGGRHRPAPAPRHHRHLDLPHRPLGGAGRGGARRAAAGQVEETGPLRVRVRLEAALGALPRALDVSLCTRRARARDARSRSLRRALHAAADADRRSPAAPTRWTDGLAGGHVEREPGPAEWPFLGWSRLRVGQQPTSALVTNDAYSHSVDGRRWQPTLLRSPKMAWGGGRPPTYAGRDHHTDQGVHRFAFDAPLRPRSSEADLAPPLAAPAQPLVVFDRYEGMDRPAWGPVPPRGLWGPADAAQRRRRPASPDPGQEPPGGALQPARPDDYAG